MTAPQPYRIPPRSINSQLLDPVTKAPVWPLRLIEQRQEGEKREGRGS